LGQGQGENGDLSAYRARLNHMEFRQLMKKGRKSLLISLLFLMACLAASEALAGRTPAPFSSIVRESPTIGGWVAMWWPLEIHLYDWWPLRQRGTIYEKLSRMKVEVRKRS
jgi:hypothetical protein